jgi:hypothetical protein
MTADEERAPVRAREVGSDEVGQPVKDAALEVAIPEAWRPILTAVVDSLVRRDAVIAAGLSAVEPVSPKTRQQCLDAINDYGDATLISLPDETWNTSVCRWYGNRWNCLVDLWTEQEGRSDLVLDFDVVESGDEYRFSVGPLYVP